MAEDTQKGGRRPGAGRKAIEDPKRTLTIGVRQSQIDQMGGAPQVKAFLTQKLAEHGTGN